MNTFKIGSSLFDVKVDRNIYTGEVLVLSGFLHQPIQQLNHIFNLRFGDTPVQIADTEFVKTSRLSGFSQPAVSPTPYGSDPGVYAS
ncbi:hypothetical protein [Paenibacillus polymyxa]|uniref:hypothetical protein n=1 Tax=Paenibacillus polymyxa TaxID=1406 RepID=UPI00046F5565|nr:hypothetical protein [Paenibacillus polymyxa]